ncbi:MAG TPA: two-component regulator propeller domain-containing protein [Steroidobacteraceae bacterium]|nr:two-component regulator propeller domain-containing protein [Steroidobacteraceae bacterium]
MQPARAAQPMRFTHLGSDAGLSQGGVMAIVQGPQGFLWLGTEDGLDRYDGYTLQHLIRQRGVAGSLPNNWIAALANDADGRLWIGTDGGGVAWRDPLTGRFVPVRASTGGASLSPEERVRALHLDRSGRLWIATRTAGLVELTPRTGSVRRFQHSDADSATLSDDGIFAVTDGRDGTLWVGTHLGLDRLDPVSGRIERLGPRIAAALEATGAVQANAVLEDQEGVLWVGTDTGLARIEAGGERIRGYRSKRDAPGSLPSDRVQALLEDDSRRVWIGTVAGLALLDRRADRFDTYHHESADPASLPDDYVVSLYEDRAGLLWIGTKTKGLAKWNPRSWSFGHQLGDDPAGTAVTAFAEDGKGTLWLGTFGAGLSAIDSHSGAVRHYRHESSDAGSLPDDRVMAALVDSHGTLWVGSMTAGLARLDAGSRAFRTYQPVTADPQSLPAPGVMSLLEDMHGNLWVGTYGGGLARLDRATDRFRRYPSAPAEGGLSSDRATALTEDPSGKLWVGTDGGGLNLLDPETGQVVSFAHKPDDTRTLSANTVYDVHVDARGDVWVGTRGGGLDHIIGSARHPHDIYFRNYSEADGLANDTVYGIESDSAGRLWLSTNGGLSRLEPDSGAIRNFHQSHGLQGDEFNFGAHFRSVTGKLFFGGPNGYNAFFPERLLYDEIPPPVVLTGVLKLDQPAQTAVTPERLQAVSLGYKDAMVTFEFTALDFTSPRDNRYQYMLQGFDGSWVEAGTRRSATYTNLPGGHYTFRVRAANSDGIWSEAGLSLPVTVAPAPWATWWARVGYVLLAGLVIYWLWSTQQRKLRREADFARRLQIEVRDRTLELAERNRELEHLNLQLKEASLTDPLTGLGNRRYMQQMLTEFMSERSAAFAANPEATAPSLVLMVIDLDYLKPINDQYGHLAGDRILIQVADILRDGCRAGDYVARWGGDEFVVAYLNADLNNAEALAERIRSRVAKQIFRLGDGRVARTSCSIGFARYPFILEAPALVSWEQCLRLADAAVFDAKKNRNAWLGWGGTAAAAEVANLLQAVETDLETLEREGRLDVRRTQFEPEDTVDGLRLAMRRRND